MLPRLLADTAEGPYTGSGALAHPLLVYVNSYYLAGHG